MHTLLGTNVKYIFAGTEGEGIDLRGRRNREEGGEGGREGGRATIET